MEHARLRLTPRSIKSPNTFSDDDENQNDPDDFLEILKRLGIPTYYSKSQFSLAEHSIFGRKLRHLRHRIRKQQQQPPQPPQTPQESQDDIERSVTYDANREKWLKVIKNYNNLHSIKPLLQHFYKTQIPQRYNRLMMRRVFQRWKVRRQWLGIAAIVNRLNLRRAANDDKERIEQRRVLLAADFLSAKIDFQPNYHYFVLNAIPNPTNCGAQILKEDEEADRIEERELQLEYQRHLEEEEEEAERRLHKKKKRHHRNSPQKERGEEEEKNEEEEDGEKTNENNTLDNTIENSIEAVPDSPISPIQIENGLISTANVNSETVNERGVSVDNEETTNNNLTNSPNDDNKNKDNKRKISITSRAKQMFVLISIVAFVLGFLMPLAYYIHRGEIHDAKSFVYVVKTTLFGYNVTEKCRLDPDCFRKTEQMRIEAENAKRRAEETERDFTQREKEKKEKRKKKDEERTRREEAKLRAEEERRIEIEQKLRKLKTLSLSQDPATRNFWIREQLNKIATELKLIGEDQVDLYQKLKEIQDK